MAVVAGAIHNVIGGALPNGEIFRFGLWYDSGKGAAMTQADLNAFQGSASGAMTTALLTTTFKSAFPPTVIFNYNTSYGYIGGTGAAWQAGGSFTATPCTGGTNPMPNQVAIVCSLRSGIPGRSYRGRLYLPTPVVGMAQPDGQIGAGDLTSLQTALKNYIDAAPTGLAGARAVVMSETKGVMTPLSYIQMDSRFDVQRRRAARESILRTNITNL